MTHENTTIKAPLLKQNFKIIIERMQSRTYKSIKFWFTWFIKIRTDFNEFSSEIIAEWFCIAFSPISLRINSLYNRIFSLFYRVSQYYCQRTAGCVNCDVKIQNKHSSQIEHPSRYCAGYTMKLVKNLLVYSGIFLK